MAARRYTTVQFEVDADVYLDEFDTDELIEELKARGKSLSEVGLHDHTDAMERAVEALLAGDAFAALEELRGALDASRHKNITKDYEAAKRGEHPFLIVGGCA